MKVYIINGHSRAGKDTFINFIEEEYKKRYDDYEEIVDVKQHIVINKKIINISTIDPIKSIMSLYCNWKGEKEDKDRKVMCELKELLEQYCNLSYDYIMDNYRKALKYNTKVMFIHCREPKEINKLLLSIPNSKTILVKRNNNYCTNNAADREVDNFNYDIILSNTGSLEELNAAAKDFIAAENLF